MSFTFTFANGPENANLFGGDGILVTNGDMSRIVEQYIKQETSRDVRVRVLVDETVAHLYGIPPCTPREKELLCRAYSWAVDHLKQ
ncbi:MAG: hypothetical protein JKY80_07055 [Mariprofundaceae bacterium]|nr:hypothetical protein [Mariprofundaceae bacterium]